MIRPRPVPATAAAAKGACSGKDAGAKGACGGKGGEKDASAKGACGSKGGEKGGGAWSAKGDSSWSSKGTKGDSSWSSKGSKSDSSWSGKGDSSWSGKGDSSWSGKGDSSWSGKGDSSWSKGDGSWSGKGDGSWSGKGDGSWSGKGDSSWSGKGDGSWSSGTSWQGSKGPGGAKGPPTTGGAKGGVPKGAAAAAAAGGAKGPAANQGGAKGAAAARTSTPTPPAPPSAATVASGMTVSSPTGSNDPIVQTLVGEYVEKGINHGRKYYQKKPKAGENVFLYFWDKRDGDDFSGWWFGDQVGGTEVWALNNSQNLAPPPSNWKVPWDAPAPKPGILLVGSSKAAASGATPSPAASTANKAPTPPPAAGTAAASSNVDWPAKLKSVTDQVNSAEADAKEMLASAKNLMSDGGGEAAEAVKEMLKNTQEMLVETQKSLAEDAKEARAAGTAGQSVVAALMKLSPRLRTLQASLSIELNKLKAGVTKPQPAKAGAAAVQRTVPPKVKSPEDKLKEYKETLEKLKEKVATAEKAVETTSETAAPQLDSPPSDPGSAEAQAATAEVEKAAKPAQEQILATKTEVQKLAASMTAGPGVMELRSECQELQKKLSAAQLKLNPFKNFKNMLQQRVVAKKAMDQTVEKIEASESEVEKLAVACESAGGAQMSEEDITSAEAALSPARENARAAFVLVESKVKTATGAMKEDLTKLRDRIKNAVDKVEELSKTVVRQRKGANIEKGLEAAQKRVEAAEEASEVYEKAEKPFLAEGEVEDAPKAVSAVEQAHKKAEATIAQAKATVKKQQTDAKQLAEGAAKVAAERLVSMMERLDAVSKKVNELAGQTFERKYAEVLGSAFEALSACEAKVRELREAAQPFSVPVETLEQMPLAELKEAGGRTSAAEKAAAAAIVDAKKAMALKAREKKQTGALAGALSQLQGRLTGAQQELATQKKAYTAADKLLKSREASEGNEEKIQTVQAEVERIEELTKKGQLSDEDAKDVVLVTEEAQKVLKVVVADVPKSINIAPASMKERLQKLEAKGKELQKRVEAVLEKTKDERERVSCEMHAKEADRLAEEVEAKMTVAENDELPFLSGMEEMPVGEGRAIVEKCEQAASEVDKAIAASRAFLRAKTLEFKDPKEGAAAALKEALAKATERVDAVAKKVVKYKVDAAKRMKTVRLQDTRLAVEQAEELAAQLAEDVKPLEKKDEKKEGEGEADGDGGAEEAPATSADDAQTLCEKVAEADAAVQAKIEEAQTHLAGWQQDDKDHGEELAHLVERLGLAEAQLVAARKTAGEFEERFVAERLLAEARDTLDKAREEVSRLTEACAPLVTNGGEEFLVAVSARTLADSLKDHMKEKELDDEAVFRKAGGGDGGKISEEAFVSFLASLAEEIGREEVNFEEKRQKELYRHIAGDPEQGISLEDLKKIFVRRFTCTTKVTVTDGLAIAKSKTVTKVDIGQEVEALGDATTDGPTGMVRIEVKILTGKDAGKSGWCSIKGNQGTVYLQADSPIAKFSQELEVKIKDADKAAGELLKAIRARSAELTNVGEGPLKAAKAEFSKIRDAVSLENGKIQGLKAKVHAAKRDFAKKEEAERMAHVERKERMEADAVMGGAREKLKALEEEAQKLKDTAAPLRSPKDAELEAFENPLSVLKECESLVAGIAAIIEDLKSCVKEQQPKLEGSATKGPMFEAKRELTTMLGKADVAEKKAVAEVGAVRGACRRIAQPKCEQACAALRADLLKKGQAPEALFDELAEGGHRISEEAFCKHLASLEGLELKPDHAGLVCDHIQKGGIGRRRFFAKFPQHYKVLREIAITDGFELSGCKTLRKAEVSEIIHILEGPQSDEKTGLLRVRGRAFNDGSEGWITVSGNKGSSFMVHRERPYFLLKRGMELQSGFDVAASEPVRTLKADEILELLEGPRKEARQPELRAKAKASKDGVQGFFTVRNSAGKVFAEVGALHVCCGVVAMTDDLDVKKGKVVRKLAIGETFTILEGPVEAGDSGIMRVRGKAVKDGKEGWITPKGNAGSVFTKESTKHYTVLEDVPLEKQVSGDSGEPVRTLEKGEVVEVLLGPKETKLDPVQRIRVRALGDASEGWCTMQADAVKACVPYYKCLREAPLRADKTAEEEGETIRQLKKDEILELVEGPTEGPADALWVKVRAEEDSAAGWTQIRGTADGKEAPLLEPLATLGAN